MNLDIASWKEFYFSDILEIQNGRGITKKEIEENPGSLPAVQSSSDNNGRLGWIDLDYCREKGYRYTTEPCLTVARSGSAGFVAFQPTGCVVGDSAKILQLKDEAAKRTEVYLFMLTMLSANRYKYTYGRKVTKESYSKEIITLPVGSDGKPDWERVVGYMNSLKSKPITTSIKKDSNSPIDTSEWKEFYLHKLFYTTMGNGIDANKTTDFEPKYNYVSRDSNGNGVVAFVDEIPGEQPFPAGSMTLALGGSFLGSCFIQAEDYYTAQNVGVLQEKIPMSVYVKLFISALIRKECRIKYVAFGRELNAHFRKDFTIKLPVQHTGEEIVIDETKEFSDDGYVPDWKWIEGFMKHLPYGDRLSVRESD